MVSDGFLCSGDDTAIMLELQHYHVAVRQHKSTAFGGKLGCQVGTSLAFAPECSLTFPHTYTSNSTNSTRNLNKDRKKSQMYTSSSHL